MKTFIFILILLAFLQTTIIPLDLVLMVLILRVYIVTEKENLFLGFGVGLLISYLSNSPLGFYSLIFLVLIELTQLFRKTPLAGHFLVIAPLMFIMLSLQALALLIFLHQSINWLQILVEGLLALPLYLVIKIWEERFVVRGEIKLKV